MIQDVTLRVYQKNPDFVARKITDEIVLIPLKRHLEEVSSIYSLNPVGAALWEQLDGKRNLEQIAQALLDEFDVELSQLLADSKQLMEQLESIQAVSVA